MNTSKQELLEFLNLTPPALVRVMAVKSGKGRKPKLRPLDDIVKSSGLSRRMVQRISYLRSWSGVKVGVASKFIAGCNVDVLHTRTQLGGDKKKMVRYYFLRNYIEKNMPHLTTRQRERFFAVMGWE